MGWQAGNTIAIAPSSYDARHVDTATITAVTQRADGTSLIALASSLQYTHLGVLRTYAGDPGQHVLDMRAEVIVFERNIVIQVIWLGVSLLYRTSLQQPFIHMFNKHTCLSGAMEIMYVQLSSTRYQASCWLCD